MKFKKIASLFATAAVVVSTFVAVATTASAAALADINPVWDIQVKEVNSYGYAVINFTLKCDEELSVAPGVPPIFYNGQALIGTDVVIKLNEDLFDKTGAVGQTKFGSAGYSASLDQAYCSFSWGNDFNAIKQGKVFDNGDLWVPLKDKTLTADKLNKMDFATVVKVGCTIGDWNTVADTACQQVDFYNDGNSAYSCSYILGVEEESVNYGEAGNDFEGKKTKYWTVDFAEWTGTADVSLTDGTTTKTINVTTAEGSEDYVIGGAVSFYVYVIGNDIANVYIVE